jgi:hypothetical protein
MPRPGSPDVTPRILLLRGQATPPHVRQNARHSRPARSAAEKRTGARLHKGPARLEMTTRRTRLSGGEAAGQPERKRAIGDGSARTAALLSRRPKRGVRCLALAQSPDACKDTAIRCQA